MLGKSPSQSPVVQPGPPEPCIETGEVAETWFEARGQPGDWRTWNIAFSAPFAKPPLILADSHDAGRYSCSIKRRGNGRRSICDSQRLSSSLAARSCDTRPGLAGFYWIAIGDPA
jgi:hypothetical protein